MAGRWPGDLVEQHERRYGPGVKAGLRARNALYFADFFARSDVDHVHVHFANRAAHTALFLKEISGIPFSITAHGQDFMKDLGSDDLLREICAAAEFVAAETDYSLELLRQRCPDSAAKIYRVYNGIDLARFPARHDKTTRLAGPSRTGLAPYHVPRIISDGLGTAGGFHSPGRNFRISGGPPNRRISFSRRHVGVDPGARTTAARWRTAIALRPRGT